MLSDVLKPDEKKKFTSKHLKALRLFGEIYNKKKQKNKHKYLYPIKRAGFSISEALHFNFKISTHIWHSCLNRSKRNKGGKPKLDVLLVDKLNAHLTQNSSIAANRYLKLQSRNARYRNLTNIEAYKTFAEKKMMSFSCFYSHIEKKFKKPHRISDLCDYCEHKKVWKKKLIEIPSK